MSRLKERLKDKNCPPFYVVSNEDHVKSVTVAVYTNLADALKTAKTVYDKHRTLPAYKWRQRNSFNDDSIQIWVYEHKTTGEFRFGGNIRQWVYDGTGFYKQVGDGDVMGMSAKEVSQAMKKTWKGRAKSYTCKDMYVALEGAKSNPQMVGIYYSYAWAEKFLLRNVDISMIARIRSFAFDKGSLLGNVDPDDIWYDDDIRT